MELKPRAEQKIRALIDKGVSIPNPLTLDIGDEVNIDNISGTDVVLYPGTRLYGAQTVISAGAILGREGTVTVDNCQIGPQVELKGGVALGCQKLTSSGCICDRNLYQLLSVTPTQNLILPPP